MESLPIHIVMTPTRNEAWVIRAFLESTTRWADYILILDQMSIDGTRQIVQEYAEQCKILRSREERRAEVLMIDNIHSEFNEDRRQAMLVAKAREIADGRDTLLWGLDADEILSANAFETEDWKRIMHSKPGAVFWFKWALLNDEKHYNTPPSPQPWLFHDDGIEPHGNYVRSMHSMRIPYPIDERDMTYVEDFRVLHLCNAAHNRCRAKSRFYKFVEWQVNHRPPYSVARQYSIYNKKTNPSDLLNLPKEWIYTKERNGWDLWQNVELNEKHCWFDDYVYERLHMFPMRTLAKLPIWDEEFLQYYNLEDPRPWYVRLVHRYQQLTQPYRYNIFVRAIDKCLKICVKE